MATTYDDIPHERTEVPEDGIDLDSAKSDDTDLAQPVRCIFVGTGGTVKVTTLGGTVLTFTKGDDSVILMKCRRVYSTGTTATGLIGGY